jgi:hypothetical protein
MATDRAPRCVKWTYTAIDWSVRECTLDSGRGIEIVDVPGHRDFNKNAFIVRISYIIVRSPYDQGTTTDTAHWGDAGSGDG